MTRFLRLVPIFLALTVCLTSAINQSPTLPYNELNEIIDLYCDGQYEIVKAKLGNIGFVVTKSIPDYTLNGITHSGDFVMMREKESAVEAYREHGFKDIDLFLFLTISQANKWPGYTYDRDVDISFDYNERGATGVYDSYKLFWKNAAYTAYHQCSQDKQCIRFLRREEKLIRNPVKDIGAQKAVIFNTLYLEASNKPIEVTGFTSTERESLHGMLSRHILYVAPSVKKPVVTGKKKK